MVVGPSRAEFLENLGVGPTRADFFFFFFFFFKSRAQGPQPAPPSGNFRGANFFLYKTLQKSLFRAFSPTQAVVARASRALLPDKVGRGVKIHGKMGKPGPDAIFFLGFCEIVGGSKKFSCARFFISHLGCLSASEASGKNF